MPNRILKESICTSEEIDALDSDHEAFFYRLMVVVDDFGTMDARPALLKAKCYPLKSIDISRVQLMLNRLIEVGLITFYTVDGRPYMQFTNWAKHQQIRAKRAKYPTPDQADDCNGNQLISNVPVIQSNPIQSESNPNPIPPIVPTAQPRTDSPILSDAAIAALEGGNHFPCPQDEIRSLYASRLAHLPQARVWGADRQKELRARWVETSKLAGYKTKEAGLAWWADFFTTFEQSTIGHGTHTDGRVWVPDLQWILKRANFEKILNGRYPARGATPQRQQPKSFAQQEREAGWARWEQQTNQIHPDRIAAQQGHVIDITPQRTLEIEQ